MKKNFIVFVLLLFGVTVTAGTKSEEKAKEALKVASIAKMSWSFWNELNLQPDNYVKNSSGKIVGQDFLYPFESKYYRIDLVWDEDIPTEVVFNDKRTSDGRISKDKGSLFWEGDQLVRIKVEGSSDFDYDIEYAGSLLILKQRKAISEKYKVVYEAFFAEDILRKIEKHIYKGTKKIVNGIREYANTDKTWSVHIVASKFGKPLKPKFESINVNCYYKELSPNSFEVMGFQNGRVKKMYYMYNEEGQLISKKYPTFDGDDAEETYSYIDNRLFQNATIVTTDGTFLEKKMDVFFDVSDQDESTPSYEKLEGQYEFNSNDELIYERRGTRYRRKINGNWTTWQQMGY
jgi:hypothetical protein